VDVCSRARIRRRYSSSDIRARGRGTRCPEVRGSVRARGSAIGGVKKHVGIDDKHSNALPFGGIRPHGRKVQRSYHRFRKREGAAVRGLLAPWPRGIVLGRPRPGPRWLCLFGRPPPPAAHNGVIDVKRRLHMENHTQWLALHQAHAWLRSQLSFRPVTVQTSKGSLFDPRMPDCKVSAKSRSHLKFHPLEQDKTKPEVGLVSFMHGFVSRSRAVSRLRCNEVVKLLSELTPYACTNQGAVHWILSALIKANFLTC
jgi:hypothetical protein